VSVESDQMKTIYDGLVVLDDQGQAEVVLPAWFDALNGDVRYQLTCVGGYAPVYIAREVEQGRFVIAGGTPGLKVSWQLTGVRRDAFARTHPVPVEEPKSPADRGRFLAPEAFGMPADKRIGLPSLTPINVPAQPQNPEVVKRN
jgi:hypothetical protein